jgi:two-component system sensor histidine kinase CpxA
MTSLFGRLWLSYLVVMALTLAATVAIGFGVAFERAQTVNALMPSAFVQPARKAVATGGTDGLLRWIVEERHLHPELQLYFVDQFGRELLSREVRGRQLPSASGNLEPVVTAPNGTAYKMIVRRTQTFAITFGDFLLAPEVFVGLILIISGSGCALVARFLTRPIEELRTGVRTIAAGDIRTRLAPALLNRRDELGSLSRDFEKMIESLESMMASKEELLRDVSHELRSPLARLKLAASLAKQGVSAGSEDEFGVIEREVDRIDRMVGEILRYSRLSDRGPPIGADAIDLADLLEEVVGDAHIEASSAQKSLHVVTSCPATVQGDVALLRSALENVLRNAIRFAPKHGRIELRMTVAGRVARIEVSDEGPGIPDQDLEKIFMPFFRGEGSSGTGLGLAIARRAVLLHGGDIRAANRPGCGLSVRLELPAATALRGDAIVTKEYSLPGLDSNNDQRINSDGE